jgi:hypothetical protein
MRLARPGWRERGRPLPDTPLGTTKFEVLNHLEISQKSPPARSSTQHGRNKDLQVIVLMASFG